MPVRRMRDSVLMEQALGDGVQIEIAIVVVIDPGGRHALHRQPKGAGSSGVNVPPSLIRNSISLLGGDKYVQIAIRINNPQGTSLPSNCQ